MLDIVTIVRQQIAFNSLIKVLLTSDSQKKSFKIKKKVARLIDVTKDQTFDEDKDHSSDFDQIKIDD